MQRTGLLTKALALVGVVLVWFPIAATVVTSVLGTAMSGIFRFDYLMPAELFPAALIGGLLLLWAALRARSRRGLIGWGLLLAVGLPVIGQAIAVVTGLASGEREPSGWPWVLVIAFLVAYTLALVEIGIAGVLLVRDIFRE
jgi:hypothetical protein